MTDGLEPYRRQLAELEARDRLRALSPAAGIDFTSNDYLALSTHPGIRRRLIAALEAGVAFGAGGSRLLRGNAPEHEALEAQAARHFGVERALFFGGGYLANFAVLSTLPQRDDVVLMDEFSHASAHEGTRAGRAQVLRVRHNDPQAFEDQLRAWREAGGRGRPWICIESLYSMDGDRAPLAALASIADRHEAFLYVDEAHATGVYGPGGRGLGAAYEGRANVLTLHTAGKALGASGALVCGPKPMLDFLINRSRPFIFATAPAPLAALAVSEALHVLEAEPERREQLAQRVTFTARTAQSLGLALRCESQIVPLIVGRDTVALQLAQSLQRRGFDVRAIRPPTVPEGTARLRIALTLHADETAISALLSAMAEELQARAA